MREITIKKIFAILISVIVILSSVTSCATAPNIEQEEGVNQPSAEANAEILSAAGLSEYEIEKYSDSFAEFFSPEEYLHLYELAGKESATPERCLSRSLFLAEQDLSTYNSRDT